MPQKKTRISDYSCVSTVGSKANPTYATNLHRYTYDVPINPYLYIYTYSEFKCAVRIAYNLF